MQLPGGASLRAYRECDPYPSPLALGRGELEAPAAGLDAHRDRRQADVAPVERFL
jgi:hypothetical protein